MFLALALFASLEATAATGATRYHSTPGRLVRQKQRRRPVRLRW